MEKPRKKEHEQDCLTYTDHFCTCGAGEANEMHDAMSAWIKGAVPTVEDIEYIIMLNSTCDFEEINKLSKAIRALLTQRLGGK
jgi:hypothetical protein